MVYGKWYMVNEEMVNEEMVNEEMVNVKAQPR
jgi:hypothetical protein